jgi:hypothetical protein
MNGTLRIAITRPAALACAVLWGLAECIALGRSRLVNRRR